MIKLTMTRVIYLMIIPTPAPCKILSRVYLNKSPFILTNPHFADEETKASGG